MELYRVINVKEAIDKVLELNPPVAIRIALNILSNEINPYIEEFRKLYTELQEEFKNINGDASEKVAFFNMNSNPELSKKYQEIITTNVNIRYTTLIKKDFMDLDIPGNYTVSLMPFFKPYSDLAVKK